MSGRDWQAKFEHTLSEQLRASQPKVNPMEEINRIRIETAENIASVRARRERLEREYDKSVVGQLGLDPDGTLGANLNLSAGLLNALDKGARHAASAPYAIAAANATIGMTDPAYQAYLRLRSDEIAQEERKELERRFDNSQRAPLQGQPLRMEADAMDNVDPLTLFQNGPQTPGLSPSEQARLEELRARPGQATEADMALLNSITDRSGENLMMGNEPVSSPERTYLEQLRSLEKSGERYELIQKWGWDSDNWFYDENKQNLQDDAYYAGAAIEERFVEAWGKTKDGEVKEGVLGMVSALSEALAAFGGQAIENQQGVLEFIVREVGEDVGLAMLPGGFITPALSRAANAYNEGIQNFIKEEGRFPGSDEMERLGLHAAMYFGAEYASALILWKGMQFRGAGEASLRDAAMAPGRMGAYGVVEGGTETVQTYAEGEANYKSTSFAERFAGGVLGATAGSGAVSPAALDDVYEGVKQGMQTRMERGARSGPSESALRAAVETAVETGDLDGLLNPESPTFSPGRAVEAMNRLAMAEGVSAERRTELATQATQVVSALEAEVGKIRETAGGKELTSQQELEANLAQWKESLATLPADADPAQREQIEAGVREREAALKEAQDAPALVKEQVEEARTQLKKHELELQRATEILKSLQQQETAPVTREEVEEIVTQANLPTSEEGSVQAAESVVRLAMEAPDQLEIAQVEALIANTENGLTQEQRGFLRAFSAAKQAAHALKTLTDVSTDVFKGDRKGEYVGIEQYWDRFNLQASEGNQVRARAQLVGLENFARQRHAKLSAIETGLNQISDSAGQVKRVDFDWDASQSQFVQRPTFFKNEAQRLESGGLIVTQKGTQRLQDTIKLESAALDAAAESMRQAYALRFAPDDVVATSNAAPQESSTAVDTAAPAVTEPGPVEAKAPVEYVDRYTPADVQAAPEKVFVFGDNMRQRGKAGQAVIRDEPNAIGIPTKWAPSTTEQAYFGQRAEQEKAAITAAVDKIIAAKEAGATVVMPKDGIGTGLAQLEQRAPEVWAHLQSELARAGLTPEVANATPTPTQAAPAQPAATDTPPEAEPAGVIATTQQGNTASQQEASNAGQPSRTTAVTQDGIEYDAETGEVLLRDTEQAPVKRVAGEGQLTLLQDAENRRSGHIGEKFAFNAANLLREYLRQDAKQHATQRPLTEVRDFLSQLRGNRALAQAFVSETLTEKQQELMNHLASRLPVFNEVVKQSLPAWAENSKLFRHQDYIGYFRNEETGEIDENVLTAVSYAMYSWLADNASLKHHDEKGVNALLARDAKTPVSPEEFDLLGGGMHRYNHVANDLGKRAAEALGLTAGAGVPQDVMQKVIGALGGRAVAALMKDGHFEMTVIPEAELAQAAGRPARPNVREHTFVRVPHDENSRILADDIVETVKGTQGLLPKLFGTEDVRHPPSYKPVPFKNRRPKRSLMGIPAMQGKILAKYNQTAYYFQEGMWRFWDGLPEDLQVLLAGGVDMGSFLHAANVKGAEGKNNTLRREIANIREHATTTAAQAQGMKTPFYMDWEVWKMGRMGIKGSLVNPQASKVHRWLTKQAGWDHKVRLDNQDGSQDKFFLAVAEAFGVKTDSQRNAASLREIREKIAGAEISAGVIAIRKAMSNAPLTSDDHQAILEAVKKGGEKMHSLAGLYALAQYENAVDAGESTFTHSLTREIDGKTNGPMFTQWLLGAAETAQDLLAMTVRGGFFTKASGLKHIGEWAENKQNHDLYQMVAKVLNSTRATSLAEKPGRARFYESIDFFMGQAELNGAVTKYGRSMVKTPVTALNFGSGMTTVVSHMNKEFVQAIYVKIQTVANEKDPAEQEKGRKEIIQHLNSVLWEKGRGNAINAHASVGDLQKFQIRGQYLATLNSRYINTFGKDIKQTLKEVFAPLIKNRDALTQAAGLTYTLYEMAYRFERQKYLRELVENGEIRSDKYKAKKTDTKETLRLYNDLTPAQEAEVRERVKALRPLVNSAFSAQTNDLESGLFLAKQDKMTDGSFTYMNTSKMAPGFGVRNLVTHGDRRIQVAPGLGSMIWQVHSADAFTAAMSFIRHNALNVHDALVVGLNEDTETARSLNQNTFEMLLSYSPPMEIAEALARTVLAFREYMEANPEIKTNRRVFDLLKGALKAEKGSDAVDLSQMAEAFQQAARVAYKAEIVKLEALKELGAVSQYTLEDGHYDVDADDVARIEQRLEEMRSWAPKEGSAEAMLAIIEAYSDFLPKPVVTVEAAPEPIIEDSAEKPADVDAEADNRTDSTNLPIDQDIQIPGSEATQDTAEAMMQALESRLYDINAAVTPQELIRIALKGASPATTRLLQRLRQHKSLEGVEVSLHEQATKQLGQFLAINRKHADGREQVVRREVVIAVGRLRKIVDGHRLMIGNTAAETIAEVITHELVHAATWGAIDNATDATSQRLQRELAEIQKDILAWQQANPKAYAALHHSTQKALGEMTAKLQEVATYGLTAKRVQEVLRRIPSRRSKGSAWSKFVNAMRQFLGLTNAEGSLLDDVLTVSDAIMRHSPALATDPAIQGDVVVTLEMADPATDPMGFTTQQIFDALGDPANALETKEMEHLQKLLDGIVTKLHGPAGAFKERARETEAVGAEEVFLKALASGKAPFISSTRAAGFTLNDQQAFVLEQLEATLQAGMEVPGDNDLARRELGQVWREAKALLKDADFHEGDWATASPGEKAEAKARRDFLFVLKADKGTTNEHLARFAALALVDPALRSKLDFASTPRQEAQAGRGLVERIRDLFIRLLDLFHHRLVGTYAGQQGGDKVWTLLDTLVDIEARRRSRMADSSLTWKDQVEGKMEEVGDVVRAKVVAAMRSDTLQNRRSGAVKAAANITALIAADRTDALMNNLEEVRQKMFTAKQGFVASLITEIRGAHDAATRMGHNLLRRISKQNEQARMQIHDAYRQAVLESFENNGKDLTKEQKAAITRVLLDTDLSALLDRFEAGQWSDLVKDDAQRQAAIQQLETELAAVAGPWFDYYVGAGRDLAEHMASGGVYSQHLMLNAHNIAHLRGTKYEKSVPAETAQASLAVLDALISLYALDYTPQSLRDALGPVLQAETARGRESGVLMVLHLHKRMQEDAREKLFGDNPTQMQKGYRAQIYNPYKSMTEAPLTARADYEAMGYKLVSALPVDPADPNQEARGLFVIMDGGLNRRLTGVVSYTNERGRGSDVHSGVTSVNGRVQANVWKNAKILAQRDSYIDDLVKNGRRHHPRKGDSASYLAPKFNAAGDLVGYRYLMKQSTKDTVLDRNNAVEDVFGAMASHAFDKISAKEQNRMAMEALKAQYDAEYAKNPDAYVTISASAQDKQLADHYKLLPHDAQQLVKELWGKHELKVRGDLLDLFFGYQKYSMADAIQRSPEERNMVEGIYSWIMKTLFGEKAFLRARQAGAVWTEIVKEVKDILVIKTGLSLVGNVMSNLSLLLAHGVGVGDMVRYHRVALEGIVQYRKDSSELHKLQLRLDAGMVTDRTATEQRILELQRDIENNPVAFMIAEGMLPTIVEDVDLHEDPYSYKSLLAQKTEKWTNKVWSPLRTVGRNVYMTHDTVQYKVLSQGTQVSDFVARYALYQHLTTRKRKRMDHGEAIQRASDMFVNYDIPSGRILQWMNDMGLMRFTKYYLRIQRPLVTLFQEHPARMALLMFLHSMMPSLDVITESGFMNRLSRNPLEGGAFDYPGVLDELATVKAAMTIFK